MANQLTDIICGEKTTLGVAAELRNDGLWLSAADFERVSGWTFKPEGFCKGEVCVPVPPSRSAEFVSGQSYNLEALARLLGQRWNLEYDLVRRGATASHNAIAVRTATNAPNRMPIS